MRLRTKGTVHPVVHAVGPERIAGRWWDGHDKTRDYFDVDDPAGQTVLDLPRRPDRQVVFAWDI